MKTSLPGKLKYTPPQLCNMIFVLGSDLIVLFSYEDFP